MAKVVFSALISDIRGRLGGNVYSFCRGVHYLKAYNPSPSNPNTEAQQLIRAAFSYYSGLWPNLPPTIREMWERYGSRHEPPLCGRSRYLKTNLVLFASKNAELTYQEHPPFTASTPRSINGFTATPVDSVTNRLAWSAPLTAVDFVQSFQSLDKNYIPGYIKYWSHLQTVRGEVGEIIHTHSYPVGVHVYYRLRTVDSFGRISPNTHIVTVTVPS